MSSSNKRGRLWILVPLGMVVAGFALSGLNRLTPDFSPAHTAINLVAFLLLAPGLLLVLPGLIYGSYLINKK